jgi:branched-chain amino acid transport system substrate-binding protein
MSPERPVRSLGVAAVGALAAVAALTGCASPGSGIQAGEHVTVYVSAPLRGPEGAEGRDVVDGARLALADAGGAVGSLAVRASYLDDTGGGPSPRWSAAVAAANARRAAEDSTAIAYLGDFDSGTTRFSLPIANQARLLQVSAASSAVDLVQPYLGAGDQVPEDTQPTGERTFGRVIPSDEVQARAGAGWAKQLGARRPLLIRGDSAYDRVIAEAFSGEARALGLHVQRSDRPEVASDLAFAAVEPSDHDRLAVLRAVPRVLGTDVLLDQRPEPRTRTGSLLLTSAAQDPSDLPAEGRSFVRAFRDRYRRRPGRYAAYGYEAMAVILDSIRRAGDSGDDRDSVVAAFFETRDRSSILGRYSIDEVGNTTLDRMSGYRVVGERVGRAVALRAP